MKKKKSIEFCFDVQKARISRKVPENDVHYEFLEHFEDHGWAILKGAIPNELADRARKEISFELKKRWNFDVHDKSTWNNWPFSNNGFCEFYHLPSFYEMRFHKPLYDVFTKLYDTEKIRVTIDRCCLKRPHYIKSAKNGGEVIEKKDWFHSGFIHHDRNLLTGACPTSIQAVISLDNTDSNEGGWQGIDRFHKIYDQWLDHVPNYKNKLQGNPKLPIFFPSQQLKLFEKHIVRPKMEKGDLLVWHSTVAHGSCANESVDKLRWAAYVNYVPVSEEDVNSRREYIDCYMTGRHPSRLDSKSHRYEMSQNPYPLKSKLEEKLLGLCGYD